LEALALGAYPIQTNTSCAGEWIDKGFRAALVDTTCDAILEALVETDKSIDLEFSRVNNMVLAAKLLSFEHIKSSSIKFYDLD
jgi:hypothetical protein